MNSVVIKHNAVYISRCLCYNGIGDQSGQNCADVAAIVFGVNVEPKDCVKQAIVLYWLILLLLIFPHIY